MFIICLLCPVTICTVIILREVVIVRQSCPDRPDSGIISAKEIYIMEEHRKVSDYIRRESGTV